MTKDMAGKLYLLSLKTGVGVFFGIGWFDDGRLVIYNGYYEYVHEVL